MKELLNSVKEFAQLKSLDLLNTASRKMERSRSNTLKGAAKDLDFVGVVLKNKFM